MISNYFANPSSVLSITEVLVSISLIISSVQNIININCFSKTGLIPWSIYKISYYSPPLTHHFFDIIYNNKGMYALNIARILLLLILIVATERIHLAALLLVSILTFLIYIRSAILCNAADQVNNIILVGLLLHYIFSGAGQVPILYFFSGILMIGYFTSGILKIHEDKWRNGYYLKQVIINRNFDTNFIINFIKDLPTKRFKYLGCYIIFWQLTCFLMPILPLPLFYLYLFTSFSFHLITGILLRLNSFIWSFSALLPSIIYVHGKITACI